MRILYVINSLNMGGAEKLCVDLIKLAKKKDIYIDIYVLNNVDTVLRKELLNENINIFNAGTNSYKSIKHLNWLIKNKKHYQAIHSHLSYSQYYVSVLRIFDKKINLITTEHNTFNERRKFKIFKILERYMYNAYNYIAVINEQNRKSLYNWQTTIKDKIIVIENGIDIEKYINGNEQNIKDNILLKNKEKKKILMIAAFREQKNHIFMLETLKELDEEHILILVGDGELKNNIVDFIEKNNLKKRVIILGIRNDIPDLIKFCDVAVLPSKWEGFGLAAVECMAGGLPIIGSNVEGLSEVIGNEELLFSCNDKKNLKKKIEKLFIDEKKYREMKKYCIENSKKYDLNFTIDKYLDIYSKQEI